MKKWQKSYFYVRNIAPRGDYINLPAYVAGPPAGRQTSWSYRARSLSQAGNTAVSRLRVMIQSEGLTGADLVAAFRPMGKGDAIAQDADLQPVQGHTAKPGSPCQP